MVSETIETPTESIPAEPTAEPVESSELPTPAEQEGSTPETTEGSETVPEGLDPDKTEAWLEAEAERRAEERAQRKEAEATARARQRAKEADDGQASRVALYDTAEREGRQAAARLRQIVQDGDALDLTTVDGLMNHVIAAVTAMSAREQESAVDALVKSALPEITDAEDSALEPLLYDLRRNGRFSDLLPKVLELAVSRKDAEIADLKKQLRDREAVKKAAEQLRKSAEAGGVGAETPKGRSKGQELTYSALMAMTPKERDQVRSTRRDEYDKALRSGLGMPQE